MKGCLKMISAAETRSIRQLMLRPDQPPERNIYPYDDSGSDFHAGIFENEILVGVASIYPETPPDNDYPGAWRLRGMAVLPKYQRQGYGRAMLETCLAYIAKNGGSLLWCNARLNAVPFYKTNGFHIEGEPFQPPGDEVHQRMWIKV